MAIVTLYVGVKGYFTDTTKLNKLDFTFTPKTIGIPDDTNDFDNTSILEEDIFNVKQLMETNKAYLNPELNLSDLAKMANMSRGQLSEIINTAFKKNFKLSAIRNNFKESYRFNNILKIYLSDSPVFDIIYFSSHFDCNFCA